jgi:hypothetical protein
VQLGDRALPAAVALGEHLDVGERGDRSGVFGSWRVSTRTTRDPLGIVRRTVRRIVVQRSSSQSCRTSLSV